MTKEEDMKRDEGFTPGPWTVGGGGEGQFTDCIMGPNGGEVVCLGAHDYDQYGYIANPADARLIAAAPGLLVALQDMVIAFAPQDKPPTPAVERAREAIAKATSSLSAAERNER